MCRRPGGRGTNRESCVATASCSTVAQMGEGEMGWRQITYGWPGEREQIAMSPIS